MRSAVGALLLAMLFFTLGFFTGTSTVAPSLRGSYSAFAEDSAWRYQTIRVVGSTTLLPIANACALKFMELYNTTCILVEGGGSGRGYNELTNGLCGIALASREPLEEELSLASSKGVFLVLHEVAVDAIAVVVHPSVVQEADKPLELTLEEVGKIFAGEYRKWSEVREDLPDAEIVVFTREAYSGTRELFEELCLKPFCLEMRSDASVVPSNFAMRESVRQTPYSIGYVGLAFVSDDLAVVRLGIGDGSFYAPSRDSALNGSYPLVRRLYLVTNGVPESGSLVDRFVDFVKSPTGQAIVEQCGFIAIYPRGDGG